MGSILVLLIACCIFLCGYFAGWIIRDNKIDTEKESDF